jgi:carbamoyltransferase
MFLLKQTTHRMLVQYHEKVGHIFVPNQKARLTNEENGYYVVTNSGGFRSDFEFKKEKSSKPRILMFGDSFTAGDDCSNSERYSDQLATMLNAEVYNYGMPGSGTDQHLLINREFAQDLNPDLIVICVQIDSMKRIQVSQRESIDRVTGQRVFVSKPYFSLENGVLELKNVPVPKERPIVEDIVNTSEKESFSERVLGWYRKNRGLKKVREIVREKFSKSQSDLYRMSGLQPYPDFKSADSQGWQLMEGILKQFIKEVSPTPVLIVPIPTYEFFIHGVKPIYQPLFETLADKDNGVYVGNVTAPLMELAWEERNNLIYKVGGHFKPHANKMVAERIAKCIKYESLLKPADKNEDALKRGPSLVNSPEPDPVTNSLPFKADGDKYVLGLACFYHNSAASLIKNGEIVAAAEEERFSRVKNDRRFPHNAVNYCLEEAGINSKHLDAVVYYDNASLTFERIFHSLLASGDKAEKMWMHMLPPWLQYKLHIPALIREYMSYNGLILQGNHHRSHAASAFYPSPFKSAAILTIDGVGEWGTASIGRGDGSKIQILKEMQFPNSLGLLYSAFTEFTGFKVNSGEYKMMGLAPYGKPIYKDIILDKIIDLKDDGSIELNMEYFSFLDDLSMTNAKFADLFGGAAREQESNITRREMDIAKSIQVVTEEAIIRMAKTAHKLTGEKNLCMAGGVALNCVANGRLLRESPFENIWIQPAAGDSGCALGVAFDVWYEYFSNNRELRKDGLPIQMGSYLGPGFSDDEIKAYLDTHGFPYKYLKDDKRADFLAQAMDEGRIAGHFSGRLEYGPRALGGRSIIGDPRNTEMQVDMNLKIKYRESFRPFAPSVLKEDVSEYFEMDCESPYMLLVAPVREDRCLPFEMPENVEDMLPVVKEPRSDLPAITHVDFSARVQTVSENFAPEYYKLIKTFKDKTGCAVIVNTSFNVRGEPIVCTPADAYRCFMRTEMNLLALGNFILTKEDQPEWPEGKGEGLESIKDETDVTSLYNEDFLKSLRKSYHSEFRKIAEQAKKEGALKIRLTSSGEVSSWVDVIEPEDLKDIFEYDTAVLTDKRDVKLFTDALLASWQYKEDADELKPLIRDLIKLGIQYPVNIDFEEDVPDSVYAMF